MDTVRNRSLSDLSWRAAVAAVASQFRMSKATGSRTRRTPRAKRGRARRRLATSLPQPAKDRTPMAAMAATARWWLNSRRRAKTGTMSDTAPRAGRRRAHSSGKAANQNRRGHSRGLPPRLPVKPLNTWPP